MSTPPTPGREEAGVLHARVSREHGRLDIVQGRRDLMLEPDPAVVWDAARAAAVREALHSPTVPAG